MLKAIQQISPCLRIEVEADDEKALIKKLAFFSEWPMQCPVCGKPVQVNYRHPQTYEYFGLICTGSPQHETTFGVKKDGSGLFYKTSQPWQEAPRQGHEADYEEEYAPQPEPARQRTEQAVNNAARGGGYAGNTGARQQPSRAPQEPETLQMQQPGQCPDCHAPNGRHASRCPRSQGGTNAMRSGL